VSGKPVQRKIVSILKKPDFLFLSFSSTSCISFADDGVEFVLVWMVKTKYLQGKININYGLFFYLSY